jgi:hypothetical protein
VQKSKRAKLKAKANQSNFMASEEERRRLYTKKYRKYFLIPFVMGICIYGLLWILEYSTGFKSELLIFTIANIGIISLTIVPMIIIDWHFRKKYKLLNGNLKA